ncbi:MAG TPA: DnaJ C-terminal domain-containing protein, partial [Gammaproteobacteria bacterium]|nr:DnaJ C-terminal domain-containing protein [Gammaproteobacteria bacterium]
YHPDVSKEAGATEKFQELGEAYEVLKDAEKRKAYDQLRVGGARAGQEFKPPPGWEFQQGFSGGGFTSTDTSHFSDFFESLFGQGGVRQPGAGRTHFQTRGEDLHYRINVSLNDAYSGTTRAIRLSAPERNNAGLVSETTRTLNVKIPSGVTQGQQIRLRDQGAPGFGGGPPGDLYLEIELERNALFSAEGKNIYLTVPITPWEAALGATIQLPTLGGTISAKIPANSQSGQQLRLKGRGLPGAPAGDQFAILKIVTPQAVTTEQKALYENMAKVMAFNPREQLGVLHE